ATKGGHVPGIRRKQVELVADGFRLRVNNDVDIARAQSPPESQKSKGEPRGQFKPGDEDVTAFGKQLLNSLLSSCVMRHINVISQCAFGEMLPSAFRSGAAGGVFWSPRFDKNGE